MYAHVQQKPFTFAARCDEAILIARFDGIETSISIHAADDRQTASLLRQLIEKIEKSDRDRV